MSLLVVDGDDQSLTLADLFISSDYEVVTATNLSLARDICQYSHPDLIVCRSSDHARTLTNEFGHIPVVLVTRELSVDVLHDALQSGFADVWPEAVDPSSLDDLAGSVIARTRARASTTASRLAQHVAELQRDQRAGRYIQMGMLPPNPMAIERIRLHHRIRPSLILSGDFVDYFRVTDDHFAFYVADVSGHGASSAFVTVLLKNFSRRLRREYRPSMLEHPGEILQWINRELLDQKIDKHVTMFLAVGKISTDRITYVNAGHFPPPVLVPDPESGAAPRLLELNGKPLGLFEEVNYKQDSVDLKQGDRIVVFSDGVLEMLGDRDLAAKEALLIETVQAHKDLNSIWSALDLDGPQASPDDVTCLTVLRSS